jgi:hypothetical protein
MQACQSLVRVKQEAAKQTEVVEKIIKKAIKKIYFFL